MHWIRCLIGLLGLASLHCCSGKSTLAKSLADPQYVFSTDDFFMVDGVYQFNRERIGQAHEVREGTALHCTALQLLRRGALTVSNTE